MAAVAQKQRPKAATELSRRKPKLPTLSTAKKSSPADTPANAPANGPTTDSVSAPLLAWYDRERRELPWRYAPGDTADPYRVWLSEIMLQQTTVKAVIPFFERFVRRWPDVKALAAAREEEVLTMWAGLGYYSRARNLHACAKAVAARPKAKFPQTEAGLIELPGIGPYTAAAIAAIAFGERAAPVDGNIERITARLFALTAPLPQSKPELRRLAATLTPTTRAGDFAQALMDLGATVCTSKRPSCLMCPLNQACRGRAMGIAEDLPARAAKPERPIRRGVAFLAMSEDGSILLRRRHGSGLLASMMEVPSTEWTDIAPVRRKALESAPVKAAWHPVPGTVEHTFTHFKLEIEVMRALVPADASLTLWADPNRCRWVPRARLKDQALPSLMNKIIAHGMKGE